MPGVRTAPAQGAGSLGAMAPEINAVDGDGDNTGGDTGGDLAARLGISLLEASPERVVGQMPVAGNTQPYGRLHGGASCVLAETLGSIGAALHAGTFGAFALGLEINATHHKSVTTGLVTGVATPLRLGRSVASYEIAISDESGTRVCTARLTCVLREGTPF
jgi:1,4-dihydroxy-2-naphthoyl-CoA hydrolase